MTQDERWLEKYNEVKRFIERNKRNPSRYDAEERGKYCFWLRHNRKVLKSGQMKGERKEKFVQLLGLIEKYRHINQYM